MNEVRKEFGARVREIRRSIGLSQQAVADRMNELGLHTRMLQTTFTKLELGVRPTSVEEVVALAAVLGVHPADLISPSDDMRSRIAEREMVAFEHRVACMKASLQEAQAALDQIFGGVR